MKKMEVGGRALITPGKEVGTICAGLSLGNVVR